jgi:GNAT superfamily N-acetyltransferase
LSALYKIRPGTERDIATISRVYVESWKTTYEGLAPDAFVKGMNIEGASAVFRDSLNSTGHSYFLHAAESSEGRIIGFADGGKERSHPEKGIGEIYGIYLLKEFQGRGIGGKLFRACVQSFIGSGVDSMLVWVMEKSPYRKFYERMEGKLEAGTKQLEVAGEKIALVSYRWDGFTKDDL